MHETAEEIDALQQLLDRSAGRANPAVSATYIDGERVGVFHPRLCRLHRP
jgi:hypothetical protein